MQNHLKILAKKINGELFHDFTSVHQTQLLAYSTDASVYQEKPLAVALPKDGADIELLIDFANIHKITLIPRAAGTSLAGQVVGNGIVVDISKYFNISVFLSLLLLVERPIKFSLTGVLSICLYLSNKCVVSAK